MSMLVCPLCGKSTSLGSFDPSDFDLDIVVKTVRGLGRGRGFEVVSSESVLGDDVVTPLIKDRVLDIVSMLLRKGCLEAEEVVSRLKIEATEPSYERNEEETLESRVKRVERVEEEDEMGEESELLEGEPEDLKEPLDVVYEKVRGMVDLIEYSLKEGDEEWVWEVDEEETRSAP